jgi:hypothetical protein
MIDQIADKNWLLGLSIAVFIDARSQPVYGSLSQFFSWIFFKRADHNVTTYSVTGLMSLAPENSQTGGPAFRSTDLKWPC